MKNEFEMVVEYWKEEKTLVLFVIGFFFMTSFKLLLFKVAYYSL